MSELNVSVGLLLIASPSGIRSVRF